MIILQLILAAAIVWGGVWTARRVVDGVASAAARRMPAPARARTQRATAAGRRAALKVTEPVRVIRARAMAPVRAQHWYEKKKAARERREARRQNRPPRNWRPRLPKVAIHVPGVTDLPQQPAPAPQSPAKGSQPATTNGVAVPSSSVNYPGRRIGSDWIGGPGEPPPDSYGRPTRMPSIRHSVPPDFAQVIARIHNTEHETDHEYLAFARGLAAGTQGIAEACDDHADHLLSGIGLDPAAVKCWHDISQAFTECAAAITRAEGQYQHTYQGATEDASRGTVMPFKGRFITGETA